MVFENLMDPIMRPLLDMPSLLAVGIVSLVVSLIITVIYKYTTNQSLMKDLKSEMKEFQNEMKELRDRPDEMMKVQKKAMQTNMKYMGQSFKSTLYTFLPIILIFGWMHAYYAFEAIDPMEPFNVVLEFQKNSLGNVTLTAPDGIDVQGDNVLEIANDKAVFILKGKEGVYADDKSLKFEYDKRLYFKDMIITNGHDYAQKQELIKNSNLKSINIDYKKKIVLLGLNWGWLGTYIIFSIIFSMTVRKWMKVY